MVRYAITDGSLRDAADERAQWALVERCRQLQEQGIDYILVREKLLAAGALVALCRRVKAAAGGAKVLVSGRVDVAAAAGLDGVHLSAAPGELTPAEVRRVLPGAWVSVSCHTAGEVLRAAEDGADAALFGPVFGKVVEGREVVKGVGLTALRQAVAQAGTMPVLALGGVGAGDAWACFEAGAAGLAGIRLFFGVEHG